MEERTVIETVETVGVYFCYFAVGFLISGGADAVKELLYQASKLIRFRWGVNRFDGARD